MNGFEVIEVNFSAFVVAVVFDSASRTEWASLELTILEKKRTIKKINFVLIISGFT